MAYYEKDGETIRTTSCQHFVLASVGNRYNDCKVYCKTLFSLLSRFQRGQTSLIDQTDPTSHVNYRFLSTPEKEGCLRRLHQLHCCDQQISRLHAALDRAIGQRGVLVDEDLHQDLRQIVQEQEKYVSEIYPPSGKTRCVHYLSKIHDLCGGIR